MSELTASKRAKVVLAVGGTGGHLFPAQGLARQLRDGVLAAEVVFIGPGLSTSRYFSSKEFCFIDIESATLFGKSPLGLVKALYKLFRGLCQALGHLRKERPSLVVGFGSFHAFPIMLAAVLIKIPLVLFESNAIPGKVNQLFAKWAKVSAVQFKQAGDRMKGAIVESAMPLWDKDCLADSTRQDAANYFSLKIDLPTVLVFGGSQGARSINRLFCEVMTSWEGRPPFQVIHLTGDVAGCHEALLCYRRLGIPAQVKVFEDRMPLAWKMADLAICRAGAGTIAEMVAFSVPSILIPYPYATDNHQARNAQIMSAEIGGAVTIEEKKLDVHSLGMQLRDLLKIQSEEREKMRQALLVFREKGQKQTLYKVVQQLLEF